MGWKKHTKKISNIMFMKETYKTEQQLVKGKSLPEDAILVEQANSFIHKGGSGILCTGFIIGIMCRLASMRLNRVVSQKYELDLIFAIKAIVIMSVAILIIVPYVHEILHALVYPWSAVKQIWKNPKDNIYFVYCEAEISKKRMILLLILPMLILAFIPFWVWFVFLEWIPSDLRGILLLVIIYMVFTGLVDFGSIYVVMKWVPKGAYVFSYGERLYWRKGDNKEA